eukprot:COSAG02_NODE_237_length_27732_cov_9.584374_18_plen_78_part_00
MQAVRSSALELFDRSDDHMLRAHEEMQSESRSQTVERDTPGLVSFGFCRCARGNRIRIRNLPERQGTVIPYPVQVQL